jgi:hypothetical protein
MGTQSVLMRAPAPEARQGPAASPRAGSLHRGATERALATPRATRAPRSFAAIPVFAPGERAAVASAAPRIALQRKLAIGEVNDPLEHEADRVAERVMRMPDPLAATTRSGAPVLRRKCACEGSGAPCAACSAEQEHVVQRKAASAVTPTEAPPIVHEVLRSPGQPLDAATRAFFEPRFGFNFDRVRVHHEARATEAAESVGARAFTVGSDLVFARGQFAPHSIEGRRLLAHEFAHVVQQSRPLGVDPSAASVDGLGHAARVSVGNEKPDPERVGVKQVSALRLARQQANPPNSGTAPVSTAVANLPWSRYVDQFTECDYDVNYKVVNYFSNILHLTYSDGAELELDIEKDFAPQSMTSEAARDAMANGTVGRGGRIFPTVLAPRTVPRLWATLEEAQRIQNEAFADFAKLAVAGVIFVLSVPAMPAGVIDEAAVGSIKATRRPKSGAAVPAGNKPPTSGPPGGSPPGPGGGFNRIPYGQTADSLGRAIGSRAAEGAKTTAGVAKAAGQAGQSGPSWINRIVDAVNALRLPPGDSADVIESATTAAGYSHGPRATLQDGTLVVTSARTGANNFIVGVRTNGSVVRGLATIEMGPAVPGGVRVTDVVWNP